MEGNYINGGIIKSISLFYKKDDDIEGILNFIGEKIDLSLFDMSKNDNMLVFDIKEDIINNNFIELLYELKVKGLYKYPSIDSNICILEKEIKKGIDFAIKECDDIFSDTFRIESINTLTSSMYDIEIDYYNIFYDGPYPFSDYTNLINYLLNLNSNALDNILKGAFCYGTE